VLRLMGSSRRSSAVEVGDESYRMMKQGQFGRVDCTTTTTTTTGSFWTLNEWASQQRRIGVFLFGIDSSAVDSSAINDNGFEYDDHMRSMQYLPRCWLC
jgi:hypothetical protein